MAAQPSPITYTTTCRICGDRLQTSAFVPLVGGKQIDPALVQFVVKLQKHVQQKHPEHAQHVHAEVMQFTGYATLSAFNVQDPVLVGMQEAVRFALHRGTRRAWITDAQIDDRIRALDLALARDEEAGLRILLRDMRDLLCEEGAYAPSDSSASKPLVSL
jgi:hypothetical protein